MLPAHILTQMGILTSFRVAKKVAEKDLTAFYNKYKKRGKSGQEIEDMLRSKIEKEITTALVNGDIPGLILPPNNDKPPTLDPSILKKLPELNKLIMVVSEKMVERQYGKLSMCYIIHSLVNLLGLTDADFHNFHQTRSAEDNEDDDDNTDDSGITP